jgi:hypothetical protein
MELPLIGFARVFRSTVSVVFVGLLVLVAMVMTVVAMLVGMAMIVLVPFLGGLAALTVLAAALGRFAAFAVLAAALLLGRGDRASCSLGVALRFGGYRASAFFGVALPFSGAFRLAVGRSFAALAVLAAALLLGRGDRASCSLGVALRFGGYRAGAFFGVALLFSGAFRLAFGRSLAALAVLATTRGRLAALSVFPAALFLGSVVPVVPDRQRRDSEHQHGDTTEHSIDPQLHHSFSICEKLAWRW